MSSIWSQLGDFALTLAGTPGQLIRNRNNEQAVGSVLAGNQIPNFLRPGQTSESYTPEQFQEAKNRQLYQLGTPEAMNIANKFIETPEIKLQQADVESKIADRMAQRGLQNEELRLRRDEIAQRLAQNAEDKQARRDEAQLRRDEINYQKDINRQLKREETIKRDTEKLSSRVEKTGAADLLATFQNLKSLIPEEGDVPGFGATYAVPNILLTEKGQEIRQSVAGLRNSILKARSGGAVTPQESDRLLQELGEGYFKDDKALKRGIRNAEATIKNALKNVYAGFDQDVIDEYISRGGIALNSFNTQPTKDNDLSKLSTEELLKMLNK